MKKLAISLLLVPIIYLLIAVVLILLPVSRQPADQSLDFNRLASGGASSIAIKETTYLTRNQTDLFIRTLGEQSAKQVLVLLHGSGSEGRYLTDLAQKLYQKSGVSVVIADLRGHGRSMLGKPGDIDYHNQYLDDLEDLLIMLRQQSPNSEVMLAGHSSGGGLALRYAGSSKPSFDRYILLAPFFGYKAPTVRENSGGWVQVSIRRYIGLSMLNNIGLSFLNAMPVMFFNRPDKYNDNLQLDNYSYRLNQSFSPENYAADLQKNKQPLLVLVGKNDEAFYADRFAPELNKYAAEAKLHILKGVHHLDLTSENRTAEIMAVWISRQ